MIFRRYYNCISSSALNVYCSTIMKKDIKRQTQLMGARDVSFTEQLPEPLVVGSLIIITGTPTEDIPWFAINLGCGEEKTSQKNLALHLNVRMPQRYVVRNNRQHMRWGQEETTSFRSFPFKVGRKFSVEILVDEKEYLIAVDGEHYCGFLHRTVFGGVGWVQAAGVRDAALRVTAASVYPTNAMTLREIRFETLEDEVHNQDIWKPNFIATLSNGIPEGCQLVINGRLRAYLHSFTIDLLEAGREWPRAALLLHVSVRACDASPAPHLAVLNTWRAGWGKERRSRSAPLIPNSNVSIRIVRSAGEWAVYAGDDCLGTLEYRDSPDAVRALRLRGDLYPHTVYLSPACKDIDVPLA